MKGAPFRSKFGASRLQNSRARLALIWDGVAEFDRSQFEPWAATRCALGVVLVVGACMAAGHTAYGALAGLGALYIGFASYRGVLRARFQAMVAAVLLTSTMTGVGCVIGRSDAASLLTVPAIAFALALYAVSSSAANALATQAICVLVVLSGLKLGAEDALGNMGLVMAGGLVQVILLTVVWPVSRRFPERKAISDALGSLADFFERIPAGLNEVIPGTQRFEDARAILQEARRFRWREEHDLLVEVMRAAETLRAASVGFAQETETLSAEECGRAAGICRLLSAALRADGVKVLGGKFTQLNEAGASLPQVGGLPDALEHWYQLIRTQLSDLSHPSAHLLDEPLSSPVSSTGWRNLFDKLTRLPNVDSLRGLAVSYAARYTITLEVALVISRLIPESHLYWVPLTAAIVMRPDFATTVTRGVARLVGTLGGVILAGVLVSQIQPSKEAFGMMALLATWVCFGFLQCNYAVYSVGITLYVVFSLGSASLNVHHPGAALIRLIATLGGIALAVTGYVVWPSFQGKRLKQVISEALDAQIGFGEAMKQYEAGSDQHVEHARNRARQMRLRTESLYQTAALEPWGVSGGELEEGRRAIVRLDENAAELLVLRADRALNREAVDRLIRVAQEIKVGLSRDAVHE